MTGQHSARRGQVAGGYVWRMTDNGPGVVRVRAARPDEVEALLGIQQAASVAGFWHIFPPTRYPFPAGAVRERWRAALGTAEGCVLVAERDGLPVGVVQVAPERLDGLFVLPCAWGSGVADRLHDAAVQRLRGWGCGWCRLSVLEENHRARRFYERRGWRLDGRRTRTPFPPHPPMVGYTLRLGAASAAGPRPGAPTVAAAEVQETDRPLCRRNE
jgi:diamine N-acetyltransferase